jgi:hypothetical protein
MSSLMKGEPEGQNFWDDLHHDEENDPALIRSKFLFGAEMERERQFDNVPCSEMKRRPPPMRHRGEENPSLQNAATGQQESKSVTQIREVESQIAETTQKMQALTVEVASLAKEVQPHFRLIENSFKESLKVLRSTNVQELEKTLHSTNLKLFAGMRWKADLSDNLRRVKEAEKEDPDHPLNSKIRRKLLCVGAD